MTTPRLGAPELATSQANKEETVNEQIRYIESGAGHFIFKDRDLATPPGSPADGDCYLVAASPTGAWSGQAGKIAFRLNTSWVFITAIEGFTAWVNDENAFIGYDGAAWNVLASPSGVYQPLDPDLTAIAGLTPSQGDVIYHNGTQWTRLAAGTSGHFLKTNGAGANPAWASAVATGTPFELVVACSDETTALTTGTAKVTFRMPCAVTLTGVRASVTTAPTGSVLTVDINEGGSTILSTKLTIDASEKTSTTAATPAVISDSSLADDAEITIDIDGVGSTIAGTGLKVTLIGNRT